MDCRPRRQQGPGSSRHTTGRETCASPTSAPGGLRPLHGLRRDRGQTTTPSCLPTQSPSGFGRCRPAATSREDRLRRLADRTSNDPADKPQGGRYADAQLTLAAMPRAASVCRAQPRCNLAVRRGRCAVHAPPPWAGSEQGRNARGVLRGTTLERERARRIRQARGRCESCGRSGVALDSHLGALDDYSAAATRIVRDCHRAEHRG